MAAETECLSPRLELQCIKLHSAAALINPSGMPPVVGQRVARVFYPYISWHAEVREVPAQHGIAVEEGEVGAEELSGLLAEEHKER